MPIHNQGTVMMKRCDVESQVFFLKHGWVGMAPLKYWWVHVEVCKFFIYSVHLLAEEEDDEADLER